MILLEAFQNTVIARELTSRLPTISELVTWYGPYLGTVIGLVILIIIMQFYWFNRTLSAKNKEIARLINRETIVTERLMHVIDKKTNYKTTN